MVHGYAGRKCAARGLAVRLTAGLGAADRNGREWAQKIPGPSGSGPGLAFIWLHGQLSSIASGQTRKPCIFSTVWLLLAGSLRPGLRRLRNQIALHFLLTLLFLAAQTGARRGTGAAGLLLPSIPPLAVVEGIIDTNSGQDQKENSHGQASLLRHP